ncbi:MAG: LysR family transcriptional regulator [Epsilonproteobacteria bacterium]|nr:LysR family transcriptional regulator [Campylobacterota bacterium]
MLKDFAKLGTFLTVVKEKSFSKASKKLGISQPAVTQQIKWLEDYLDSKIVERKKNGITLTKSGEELYRVALRLDKCVLGVEKEIIRIMNKELTFIIGASFTIGNFVLPSCLNDIKAAIENDVLIQIDLSEQVLGHLLDKKIDLAIIESPIFLDNIIYREWIEDEMIMFSNQPLPKTVRPEDLNNFSWVCREETSHSRRLISEVFEEANVECKSFDVRSTVTSPTALKQTVLKAPKTQQQTVGIVSKQVVEDEVEAGILYCAKVRGLTFKRSFYVAYLKDRKHDAFIDKVTNFIMSRRKF